MKKNELYGILDASAVTTNMLNAAHAIGLGIWMGILGCSTAEMKVI